MADTIYQKLAKIRKMTEVVRKNKSGFNYKYVTEDEILARVTAGMDKYGVMLIPSIVPGTMGVTPVQYTKTKPVKGGGAPITETINEVLVEAQMVYTWVNLDDPTDKLEIAWTLVGQQADASQAVGSALTYLNRYFLMKFFQIATPEDDPDRWRAKQQEAAEQEDRELAAGIIDDIQTVVSNYMTSLDGQDNAKDEKTAVSNIIKKFAKKPDGSPSADYRNITDPTVASALLEALNKHIGGKKQ